MYIKDFLASKRDNSMHSQYRAITLKHVNESSIFFTSPYFDLILSPLKHRLGIAYTQREPFKLLVKNQTRKRNQFPRGPLLSIHLPIRIHTPSRLTPDPYRTLYIRIRTDRTGNLNSSRPTSRSRQCIAPPARACASLEIKESHRVGG